MIGLKAIASLQWIATKLREARGGRNDRALRDEGTSYHYLPPSEFAEGSKGILAVEMEAAALYTFAGSADVPLLCLAHVTNTMGQDGKAFEKGTPTAHGRRSPYWIALSQPCIQRIDFCHGVSRNFYADCLVHSTIHFAIIYNRANDSSHERLSSPPAALLI
jgi:hypothetical protein